MHRHAGSAAGFTLLEVLVALAILSATLVLAYQVMSGALSAEERSEQWTAAAFLGETLVREAASPFPEIAETEGRFPPPNDAYTWKRTIAQAAHSDAREIRAAVTWSAAGREETVVLTGLAVK